MHPLHHAEASVKRWGGRVEDYIPIHDFFDASKAHLPDYRHRALRHHSQGIFWAEEVFGIVIQNSDGRRIPVRFIGEQHVKEDLGWIPTLADWFENLQPQDWMRRPGKVNAPEPLLAYVDAEYSGDTPDGSLEHPYPSSAAAIEALRGRPLILRTPDSSLLMVVREPHPDADKPLTTSQGVPIDTDAAGNPLPDQPEKYVSQSTRNRTGGF